MRDADPHVVGDDVDEHPESAIVGRGSQLAQAVLAAAGGIHPGMIDHVVAVRRARPGLQHR